MRRFLLALPLLALTAPAFAQAPAAAAAPVVDAAERTKIESVVKDLFAREPELVMNTLNSWQAKQKADQERVAAEGIKNETAKLYSDAGSPFIGNAKGDVTIVEFFDYNCGYCKRVYETLEQLVKADTGVKVVFKEYPILGPTSLTAAQASVAAHKQGKFEAMHIALMKNNGPITEASIADLAKSAGLDVEKLKKDMASEETKARLSADSELGRKVGVSGTPGFIVGDKLYPGAMDLEMFKNLVKEVRAAKPKAQ